MLPIWRPQSADEAKQAVLQAATQDQSLRVLGSGSRPWVREQAPAAGRPADAILQLDQLRKMLWIDSEDRTCCVEAGISLAALDAALAEHGLMLPIFDASQGTLGGALLGGSPSLLAAAWGLARDQVLGASWLLPDGRVVRSGSRVVKSVAGYDVTRLFLGSRGQLAACLNLTVRLRPRPSCWASLTRSSAQREQPLPSGLWLAVDLPGQGSEDSQGRQLRVYSDPLAVPPGLAFDTWTAEELETHALAPIRERLHAVRGWTHGSSEATDTPLAIDRASGLSAWRTRQAIGWPPPPSAWLAQVQAVVRGKAAPFV
jgi:FAD/FMN-containing dehydrogenase